MREDFGSAFKWGVATAAYQIEGAVHDDGRSDCVWDVFARKKGKIRNGDHARHACDFYHRYEQDLELVKELGFEQFRFSISWSRILPDGHGRVNQAGIDYYSRLIDRCITLGIEPWITLYHWDLPQVLEKSGGKTFAEQEILPLVQLPKAQIARTVFGTDLESFRNRSRKAYSGQQMLEEYVSFYQNL